MRLSAEKSFTYNFLGEQIMSMQIGFPADYMHTEVAGRKGWLTLVLGKAKHEGFKVGALLQYKQHESNRKMQELLIPFCDLPNDAKRRIADTIYRGHFDALHISHSGLRWEPEYNHLVRRAYKVFHRWGCALGSKHDPKEVPPIKVHAFDRYNVVTQEIEWVPLVSRTCAAIISVAANEERRYLRAVDHPVYGPMIVTAAEARKYELSHLSYKQLIKHPGRDAWAQWVRIWVREPKMLEPKMSEPELSLTQIVQQIDTGRSPQLQNVPKRYYRDE